MRIRYECQASRGMSVADTITALSEYIELYKKNMPADICQQLQISVTREWVIC